MKFLYEYWFCIYLRTRAYTRADIVPVTLSALFRPQKTYFLLSEGSKSLIITFFLFPELDSIKNITMFKKLPDHFKKTQSRLFGRVFFIASLTVLCDPAAAEYSPGAEDGCSARFRTLRSLKPIGYSCIHWVWWSILLIAAGVLIV